MKTPESLYSLFLKHRKVSTDSRNLEKDAIFFALRGDNFDGNQFVLQAIENGAAAAVSDRTEFSEHPQVWVVDDTLRALQQLAMMHRKAMPAKVIGITGSNGKTTTKELIAAVLSKKYEVLYTRGNLNNHIGVPLTLLQLKPDTELAVIEMGANHQGEIAALSRLAMPDCGLITNIGKAHLEGFGGFTGVINAKSELYAYLDDHGGKVFVNIDNELLDRLSVNLDRFSYGQNNKAEVYGELVADDPFLSLVCEYKSQQTMIHTQITGQYNFENIMAAVAVGNYFEVDTHAIAEAIENYLPANHRSQIIETERNQLLMDAYNANPTSMEAALINFSKRCGQRAMLILGDMLELGEASEAEHANILKLVIDLDFRNVVLVGPEFAKVYAGDDWIHVNKVEDLISRYKDEAPTGYEILIKGSRGIQLEKLLPYL
ncbi:MAG: UDP-N-acetylmuramoyl-tripeptide--D-alanyl-D-alanine ligase [Bacteroidales bacterium]|jgi:UDP-N-acetylmuramoyl-tripeptide--D-alanyl-D-alanine ligase|nr:UDP-N-acetylmuramoyl-tripeptide--D-alanyl-D-alanine ligase [Bacteroidales bacterium]MDY0084876.1 UDP-N-acetylmuramoyl-tripeptide--D-alanyl-D-alanine ligase [Bacteroidales bacterium]